MAAVLAEGETLMENCAREPEVTDLAALLTAMGARIEGAGTTTMRVQGVERLHGARHRINPDRIEAGTFLVAGAITGGDLTLAGCNPSHLSRRHSKAARVRRGMSTLGADSIRVRGGGALHAANISTEEYPGFPTDMQAQFMALATQAEGTSRVTENIFENRFMHVQEMIRMGANIRVDGRIAIVTGKTPLSAAAVMAPICAPRPRWFWPRWWPKARPSSTACITSTAAMSGSRKSCAEWARRFDALGMFFGRAKRRLRKLLRKSKASAPVIQRE